MYQAARGGITSNVVNNLKAMLLNTTKMEKYVKHICSTSLTQPINGPCVQFAVFFASGSGKKKHFLWLELERMRERDIENQKKRESKPITPN